tara:strand:+ start:344 stop:1249 length:906 start_codon:yes stop_codon:yes gene_type:complete
MHGLIPIALIASLFLFSVFLAVALLKWRRNVQKRTRRSPLTSDLLRPPGQRLREQLDEVGDDVDIYVSMLMFLPALIYSVHVSQSYFGGAPETLTRWTFSGLLIFGGIAYCLTKLLRLQDKQDKLRIGYDAELAVGQELDQLMRQGAAVFHDFPAEKFNIDHVVISPVGVFAVETKGRAKPILEKGKAAQVEYDGKALKFPTWIETEPIAQAERQAKWLRNWLTSAAGEPVAVRAVLAIPGWYVKRTGRGAVNVYSGRELETLVSKGGFDTISTDKMQRIIHQVEQRCRNIEPTFNRVTKG